MSSERRSGFRCQSSEGLDVAVIRVGRREEQVRLVNESAQGFAVTSTKLSPQVGTKLIIRTNRGWSSAVVSRVDLNGERCLIGLKRTLAALGTAQINALSTSHIAAMVSAVEVPESASARANGSACWIAFADHHASVPPITVPMPAHSVSASASL